MVYIQQRSENKEIINILHCTMLEKNNLMWAAVVIGVIIVLVLIFTGNGDSVTEDASTSDAVAGEVEDVSTE